VGVPEILSAQIKQLVYSNHHHQAPVKYGKAKT